jgi:Stress responsive A/B Barrel Domain
MLKTKIGDEKMITNNLLLKLKEKTSDNIEKTRDMLLSMQGKIEFLRDLRVELDIRHGASSYDIMLITQFASMKDFDAYLIHPTHVEVAKYIASVLESAAAVCYESH